MSDRINLFSLAKKLSNRQTTFEWLREMQLVPTEKWCAKHKKKMVYMEAKGSLGYFRCYKFGKYDHSITMAHNTWFERCHLSLESCVIITYAFAWQFSYEQTRHVFKIKQYLIVINRNAHYSYVNLRRVEAIRNCRAITSPRALTNSGAHQQPRSANAIALPYTELFGAQARAVVRRSQNHNK